MRSGTIAWLLGLLALLRLEQLPQFRWGWLLAAGLLIAVWRRPSLLVLGACLCGFAWAGYQAHDVLGARSELLAAGAATVTVEGVVEGLPHRNGRRVQFYFRPDQPRTRLQLSWYQAPELPRGGERWRLELRLRSPRGARNLHGPDYEAWLFRQRIAAVGQVLAGSRLRQPASRSLRAALDGMRQRIALAIQSAVAEPVPAALITALAVGDRQALPSAARDLLVRTGTMHLLAISGLHIGLVAAFGFFAARALWARLPGLCGRWPAPRAGAVAGLLAAVSYAGLAGLSLPTQRALAMTAAALAALLLAREVSLSRVLALALLATTWVDPLAPLGADFWLSFGAVAAIGLIFVGRLGRPTAMAAWWRAQWLLPAVMIPASLALFGSASVLAGAANLVAVPWVSMVAVPLTLLGVALELVREGAGAPLWSLAAAALALLMDFLPHLDRAAAMLSRPPPSLTALAAALLGAALLLGPRGLPGRAAGLVLLAVPLLPNAPTPARLTVSLLDSGPDSFVAVAHDAQWSLIFGTGRRRGAMDPGQRQLPAYLLSEQLPRVDTLVLSGPLGSRAGGARSLLEQVVVGRVVVGDPLLTPVAGATSCASGSHTSGDALAAIQLRARRDHPSRCLVLIPTANAGLVAIAPDGWSELDAVDSARLRAVLTTPEALPEVRRHLGAAKPILLIAGREPGPVAAEVDALQTDALGDLTLRAGADGSLQVQSWEARRRRLWHPP